MFVTHRLQQHGNAVNLKGVYEDAHNVYIVMEELRGGDLEQLMEARSSPCRCCLPLFLRCERLTAKNKVGMYFTSLQNAEYALIVNEGRQRCVRDCYT